MNPTPQRVAIDAAGRALQIEYAWLEAQRSAAPLLIFLHEGLGSLAMWREFPRRLCIAADCRGLVYSRPGYGRSTPRAPGEDWPADYLHREAFEVLPALEAALGIDPQADPPWLFGHSDGGSIALLHAARFARQVAGAIVVAPHIMVEDRAIAGIVAARAAYRATDLRRRLARYHDDPDSAFWGWNRIWLAPAFRDWSIEAELAAIRCPLLAVQGCDDEYGTLEQIRGIVRRVPQARGLELDACGHSPHRDQPERLVAEVAAFIRCHRGAEAATGRKSCTSAALPTTR